MSVRVQRFKPGDRVTVERGGLRLAATTIRDADASDPIDALSIGGPGTSAKYRIDGYEHPVYDWMLDPAPPRVVYDLVIEMNLAAVLPAVAEAQNSINEALAGFGFHERAVWRGRPLKFTPSADRELTPAEIDALKSSTLAVVIEQFPDSQPAIISFTRVA